MGILDRVPVPGDNECILLYQVGNGKKENLLICNGEKYSSAMVRHGRYNRKVTFSLMDKKISLDRPMLMEGGEFCFDVTVKITAVLQDVKEYFFLEKINEEDIRRLVRDAIKEQDERWSIREGLKAQNVLEESIEKKLKRYESIRFKIYEVRLTPDEAAAKMLKSNRDKAVGIHISQNEADEQIAKNEQTKRVHASEYELKMQKINEMGEFMKRFGCSGPVVDEYIQGNMTGKELYDHIVEAKTNDMSMLNMAMSGDLITQEEAIEKLSEILGNTKFLQLNDSQKITKNEENIIIEEKKQKDIKEDALKDGDYL